MANKILVDVGEKKELAKIIGCSKPTIRAALEGKEITAMNVRIRKLAIERGGIEIEPK